ncbi:hypothetical protein [Roseobacter denitrificans]|nr:hypothetical protein [Roseobacter denitrificans]SFF81556.1 hypothetical protein SAMN05443635_102387 [Roseobacter denitrificans OCh 114]
MREIFLAFATMGVIAVTASYVLPELGFSSQAQTTGDSVRLD